MTQKKPFVMLVIGLLFGTLSSTAQDVSKAGEFLSAPEDAPAQTAYNYIQYTWGKSQRGTNRGEQAKDDLPIDVSTYASAFSGILGINITERATPKIYDLLNYGLRLGKQALEGPQRNFSVERPYSKYDESPMVSPTQSITLGVYTSYPAVPAMMGWLSALMLTEICPALEERLLVRGYQFGESTLIAGLNWESDVTAGRLLASALLPLFHNAGSFNTIVAQAKNEYESKTNAARTRADGDEDDEEEEEEEEPVVEVIEPYFTGDELPDPVAYLPAPPDTVSTQFLMDVYRHEQGKATRQNDSNRAAQARKDADGSWDNVMSVFADAFGLTVSESNTPEIYELLRRSDATGDRASGRAKSYYQRLRPYVRFNESTLYPQDEEAFKTSGSYPSGHAMSGWLFAMLMSEINPDNHEALMQRGYEFGQSRVIAGYHWQSDVDASRAVAAATYARLHTSDSFNRQMVAAKEEFRARTTGVRGTRANVSQEETPIYTLGGVRVEGQPSRPGVYVQGHKKVAY